MKTKPFNNNVLVEIVRDDDGVSRTNEQETRNKGILIDHSVSCYSITASSAIVFTEEFVEAQKARLDKMIGKLVRWEEFAEGGQTFEEDGKSYALVAWWRILSTEEA